MPLDCITASAANRTVTTAAMFAEAVGFPADRIAITRDLYFVGPAAYLEVVQGLDESCRSAMLVGHNPTITEFANGMAGADIDYIPTCGLVQLKVKAERWAAVNFGDGELLEFDYPKKEAADD